MNSSTMLLVGALGVGAYFVWQKRKSGGGNRPAGAPMTAPARNGVASLGMRPELDRMTEAPDYGYGPRWNAIIHASSRESPRAYTAGGGGRRHAIAYADEVYTRTHDLARPGDGYARVNMRSARPFRAGLGVNSVV